MAKKLRQALAQRQAERVDFDVSPVLARPGRRTMPGALLVERRFLLPDPDQPRKAFDEARLQDLADSLRQVGILQPLRVRTAEEEGFYFIVNGERRWRAAGLADVNEVPVVVRDSPADVRAFEMLVENLQRENLSDEEEANAYRLLIGQGYTVEQIASRLGVSKSRVSRDHRIFSAETLADAVVAGRITKSQAQELLVAPYELRAPLVTQVADTRAAGGIVPVTELRAIVNDVRDALDGGASADTVMESVATRNTFRPADETVVRAHVRRRPIDRALDDLIVRFEGLLDSYPHAMPGAERVARLDAALARYQAWIDGNGVRE
jgi:ParB/RepB/Spo0J family partition protein